MEGERIAAVIDGMKVFRLNHGLDGVDVSAQHASREAQGRVEVSPGRDVQLAAVQGVIKKRRRNLAAGDSPQLAGALELSEGERLEERLGRRVEGLDAAHRKAMDQRSAPPCETRLGKHACGSCTTGMKQNRPYYDYGDGHEDNDSRQVQGAMP